MGCGNAAEVKYGLDNHCRARARAAWLYRVTAGSILAEGAMTLPVTLSGGVLFAS